MAAEGAAEWRGLIHTCTIFLVFGQFKPRSALARHPAFAGSFSADVSAAVLLIHAVHAICEENRNGDNLEKAF